MQERLLVSSLNCRGLGNGTKRRTIFQWLKRYNNGIVFLQESHSTLSCENTWRREWGGDIYFCHGTNNSRGVVTLIPKRLDITVNNCVKDESGRLLILDITYAELNMVLVNIYAPRKENKNDQLAFIDTVGNTLSEYIDKNLVLGGDFNVCLEPSIDKSGGNILDKTQYAEKIESLKEEYNIGDIWRIRNPDLKRYTWRSRTRNGYVQTRLDFWLVSNHMMYDIVSTDIKPSIKSDHSLISIMFNITGTNKRGPGFWKFNTSLLKDIEYVTRIKESIQEFKRQYQQEKDKSLVWDTFKCEIRTVTLSYSSYKAKTLRQRESNLQNQIKTLEASLDKSDENIAEYNNVKKEYEDLQVKKAQGIIIRSRASYVENNEKCTKYFLGLEKRNYNTKYIRTLISDNNEIIVNHNDIMQEQQTFFQNLYTAKKHESEHTLENCNILKGLQTLDDIDKLFCENDLTIEEIAKNVKQLPNNKSPGCDGLTIDFYKFFWVDIREMLFECFQYCYKKGILSLEQRRAILSLIPKSNKDLRMLKNCRPLSLLNTDYKILAKTLASRLQNVIGKLINDDQTGCLKGRFIGKNIRTIIDVIDFTNYNQIPGLMVMLDFEKAFDSVSWQYLFKTLECYNFGQKYIRWIKLLYNRPSICVTNNGFSTPFFPISRGIRQGCPISAFLFLLVAETMAESIRASNQIKGIKISENCTLKLTQYADDTTLFLEDELLLKEVFQFLNHFGKCSGLNINKEKTMIMALGTEGDHYKKVCGIKCATEPIKTLGVWISKNNEEVIKLNFREKIEKMKTILNIWRQRALSIKGKVVIINSLALSQLQYISNVLYVPQNIIEEVNSLIFAFLWPKKVHVKKEVTIQDLQNGGLKMPDFVCKVKASKVIWVKRILDNRKYINLVTVVLNLPIDFDKYCSFKNDVAFLPSNIPPFYKQLLKCWYEIYSSEPVSDQEIRSEYLWYNKRILINQQPVFYSSAYKKGVQCVNDLLDSNSNFFNLMSLNRKYDINWNVMTYNSIKAAIPSDWKRKIKDSLKATVVPSVTVKINNVSKDLKCVTCKDIYWEFVSRADVKPTATTKWERLYNDINFEWEHIFYIPYRSARDTKLQSLQYQILHRYYPTKSMLHKWYNNIDENCVLCNETDTIEHYFYSCMESKHFWESFNEWWVDLTTVNIKLSLFDIIFGILNENEDIVIDTLNYLLLLGKWFISNQKKNENECKFKCFLNLLEQRLCVEEIICIEKGTYEQFVRKWQMLYECQYT